MTPLMDKELDKHTKKIDEYAQKEGSVQEVIYEMIGKSTFLQVKN